MFDPHPHPGADMTAETVSDPHPCEEEVDDLIGAVLRDGREIEAGCQESGTCSGDVLDARERLEKAINEMTDRAARPVDWSRVRIAVQSQSVATAARKVLAECGHMASDATALAVADAVVQAAARGKEAGR